MKTTAGSLFIIAAGAVASLPAWSCSEADIRYSSSNNRIYIENGATCSPGVIETIVVSKYSSVAPGQLLEQTAPATWLVKAELHITDGSTLQIHGTTIGGDTDSLLLWSENGGSPSHVKIQAKAGNVDIRSTKVSSWDPASSGPDTNSSNGRAFIHVNSIEESGVGMESRMDIVDSEVSYLGFYDAESYGLVWKVRGGNVDHTIYDRLEVYGDILNSYIHHNYMGMYSFGSLGMVIDNNEVAFNESYGLDPHDDSDALVITNNDVHDNGNHGIICSRRCNDLIISDNQSYRNLHGIMLHRDVINTVVENNNVYDNADTGIALLESHNNIIRNNTVSGNDQGIRLSLGSHDNLIAGNNVENNTKNGLYQYGGSDLPETTNGRPSNNTYSNNTVGNNGRLVKLRDSDQITFESNIFAGNGEMEIHDSTALRFVANDNQFDKLDIKLGGTAELPADVTMELDQDARVEITDYATLTLLNPQGRVFTPLSGNTVTVVGGTYSGSSTLLDSSIPWGTDVLAQPLFVSTDGNPVEIREARVDANAGSLLARAPAGNAVATFRMTGLTDGDDYQIYKDSVLVTTLTATGGEISDSDALTSTEVEYSVVKTGAALPLMTVADAYVRDGFPDSNYGSSPTLETKLSGAGYNRQAFLSYDISGYNQAISEARIVFTAALSRPGSVETAVYGSASDWSESTLTWNNKPGLSVLLGSVIIDSDIFQTYEVDATDYINALIAAGQSIASISLVNTASSTAVTRIRSKEYGSDVASELHIVP